MGSGLREGWKVRKLGDVCEIYQPKTISKKEMNPNGKYYVFGANGIIGKYDKYNHEDSQLLITCRGATCGSVNISKPQSWINGNAMVIKPVDTSLNIKFIEYFFRGGIIISDIITGAAQPQITRQQLSPVTIPLPPLQEQEKIVTILDEAFSAIAKVKANAELNLQNAKELFESYLQGVFENRSEDWEEKRLGEMADFRNGVNFAKNAKGKEIKIVGVKNFQKNFLIPLKTLETINMDGNINNNDLLKNDDILTVRSNGNPMLIGRMMLAKNVSENTTHSGFTIRIRLNSSFLNSEYLCHYLKTKKTIETLIQSGVGVGIKSLNQGSLSSLLIPIPPFKIQKQIVKKLNTLQEQTKKLESIYTQKLQDLEELKKSILQKAFNGELT